jgi:uncharacterized protein YdhG (YjbR/CyaY superfamily)
MEEVMNFIYGMLTMVGIATIVTVVIGMSKIVKLTKQQNQLWHAFDNQNNSTWAEFENVRRVVSEEDSMLHRRIDEVGKEVFESFRKETNEITAVLETRRAQSLESITKQIENLENQIESVIDTVNDINAELTESINEEVDALTESINIVSESVEDSARNSQMYLDSKLIELEAKLTSEKANKKVLKG